MLATHPPIAERVIDAVIESPPSGIRERGLLQAIDWRGVDPSNVERLLEALSAEGIRLPTWLTKALIVGGHTLPAAYHSSLDAPLAALNNLNRLHSSNATEPDGAAESGGAYLALVDDLDPDLVSAGVRRLAGLGRGEFAARLAIAHWVRVPQLANEVKDNIDALTATLPEARIRLVGFSTTHGLGQDLAHAFASCGYRASVSEANYGQVLAELMQISGGAEGRAHDPARPRRTAYAGVAPGCGHKPRDVAAEAGSLERGSRELREPGAWPDLHQHLAGRDGADGRPDRYPSPLGACSCRDVINARLAELARAQAQIVLIDANRALAGLPPRRWIDPKLWYYGRLPYSADATRHLAAAFAEAYRAPKGGVGQGAGA